MFIYFSFFQKSKNESTYEHLVSLKLEKAEKDAKIAEAAFHMELLYGRGRVTVIDDYQTGMFYLTYMLN